MSSQTFKLHTKAHTVRGRPTLKDVERFQNGSVHELYVRSTYKRILLSEPSIENYAISNELSTELSNVSLKPIHEHRQVSRRDREPSRIPIRTMERLKKKSRKVRMLVYKLYPNHLDCIVMWKLENNKIKQSLYLNTLRNLIIV